MRRQHTGIQLLTVLMIGLLIVTATGCGETFDVTFSPNNECWEIEESLTLSSGVTVPTVRPELQLTFDQDYPYTNLQLKMSCTAPSGKEEVYEFQTTVLSATGDWLIESAAGGYQVIIALADEFETTEVGDYTFTLTHNMRDDQICGIRTVGLRVPK